MHSSWTESDSYGWSWKPTPAVKWLIITNFLCYICQLVLPNAFLQTFGLYTGDILKGHLWQLFTYMFLHGDIFHLLFNLLTLFFFGNEVEHSLGTQSFLRMYFLAGIVAGIAWFGFNIHAGISMIGASGAIYSVLIAFATLHPNRPITLLVFFVLPITILAKYMAYAAVALSVLYSITSLHGAAGGGVAHLAHLAGAAFGYLYVRLATANSPSFSIPWKFDKSRAPRNFQVHTYQHQDKVAYIQQRIDPILDKIAEHGIQSLTKEERQLLDEAKDKL